ncbi:MAG TPA: hypothetical protein VGI88_04860, partial [Verrucomicrobiae bacterium]
TAEAQSASRFLPLRNNSARFLLAVRELRNGFAILNTLSLNLLRPRFHEKLAFLAGGGKPYRKFFGIART